MKGLAPLRRRRPACGAICAGIMLLSEPCASSVPVGASFLKIGVGARAEGMSAAFTSVADDASSVHWNPAGLARLTAREVSATHVIQDGDGKFNALAYGHPFRPIVLGVGVVSLAHGSLEGRDEEGGRTGSFTPVDTAVSLAAGKGLGASASVGVAVKFVRQDLAEASVRGVAADAGLLLKTPVRGLEAGFALQNMGPSLRLSDEPHRLPFSLAAGAAWRRIPSTVVSLDFRRFPAENETGGRLGIEFSLRPGLALRAGYAAAFTSAEPLGDADLSASGGGFSGGVGFLFAALRVDYSFSPSRGLGDVQRITLARRF